MIGFSRAEANEMHYVVDKFKGSSIDGARRRIHEMTKDPASIGSLCLSLLWYI